MNEAVLKSQAWKDFVTYWVNRTFKPSPVFLYLKNKYAPKDFQ